MKAGVLVIHGMGAQTRDFANGTIAKVNGALEKSGANPDELAWEPAYWADVLQPREDELLRKLSETSALRWGDLRKFVLSAFGDAIAYQRVPWQTKEDIYGRIHDRIREHLRSLREKMGGDQAVIVLAHSLGATIMSDFIWDQQKEESLPHPRWTPTERLANLAGMVTFGCNLPLFSLAYNPFTCFRFPPPTLPAKLVAVAKWYNIFDPDDVLGYPLKALSPSHQAAVTEDIEINAGGLFTSWNPLSHNEYWTDDDFIKPVTQLILQVTQNA